MKYFSAVILLLLVFVFPAYAQPHIDIRPGRVEFEDIFSRYDYAEFINTGDQLLLIDSISLTKDHYLLDLEDSREFPAAVAPGDTLRLNITLTNFYNITVADTTDTLWIYSNDPRGPRDLRIRIDFFNDDYGDCAGRVMTEEAVPIPGCKLYFFYYGVYLFDSTDTDASGNYYKLLPKGSYTIAAGREGYRVMFSGNTADPYFAQPVELDSGKAVNVDFNLPAAPSTGYSVTGSVIDSVYGNQISKGVVVIRKGTHTPTLKKTSLLAADSLVYAGFIQPDGSFNITVADSAWYFVQAYSNYFLPAYYTKNNTAPVFWQNADSLLINHDIAGNNIYLKRDSSYGGGKVYGEIRSPYPDYEGITILARSAVNDQLYSYNFGKDDGTYSVANLPYGTYQLVAQKVGLPNAYSSFFTISSESPSVYNINIQFALSGTDEEELLPNSLKLYPNYPNPFNPSTTIGFYLTESAVVSIKVYNLLGSETAILLDEYRPGGYNEVTWNASGMPSGVYLYRLRAGDVTETRKMILLK